ncbi:MAG: hypothetical protein HC918_05545 [Oscillatoriales cyanobacterium SM2_1_8]|nr:hypothetical protein [Oscillatoriales cyanobacterium SM2_1_8]
MFQVCLEPGGATAAQLREGAALWVEAVLGEDPEPAGDFAVSLELAFRIENGEIVGRVKDGTLAGNVLALLPQATLGSDRQWVGHVHTPAWHLADVSLNG